MFAALTRIQLAANLTSVDLQRDGCYNVPGCTVRKQCLSRPVGVHLILVDPWPIEWGQPQFSQRRGAPSVLAVQVGSDLKPEEKRGFVTIPTAHTHKSTIAESEMPKGCLRLLRARRGHESPPPLFLWRPRQRSD